MIVYTEGDDDDHVKCPQESLESILETNFGQATLTSVFQRLARSKSHCN